MGLSRHCAIVVAAATAVVLPGESIRAQVSRSGGAASAQLMQQMQQLASERTALQAENAKLKKDLESVRQEQDALKKTLEQRARSAEGSVKADAAKRAAAEQELAQSRDKLQQLVAKFRETTQTLREIETDRAATRQSLAARDQDLRVCIDRNLELYKLNEEVLTRLEHQSVWGSLARAEPFTRIKRVQLENLVDNYKSRADDQRPKPATPPPTTSAPPGPASSTPPDAQPVPR